MVISRALALSLVVLGCGNKASAPVGGSGSDGSAAAPSDAAVAKAPPDAGAKKAPDGRPITKLPPATNTAPKPTTDKLDRATLEKLAALEYESFNRQFSNIDKKGQSLDMKFRTKEHPWISVQVAVSHCFDCWKMDLETWRAKTSALKNSISPELRELKTTEFSVHEVKLGDATLVGTYQLGSNVGAKEEGAGRYTNAFVLYYNDGKNSARVMASYADDPLANLDAYKRVMPRSDLQLVATRFMDAVTHAW